ncbi:mesenchyme-specific cell surface glycoprotein-like [Pomacea canaliculata]|uniref:mesenchyme-specific cell surface glycoprotein-like n=1 Tax=Pomacea canaliculata TaxID=400727 RepID=UPI000D7267D0|nr:mesenchyme-specific cell surface glycoprotein-like [Pomacea canaliculata]
MQSTLMITSLCMLLAQCVAFQVRLSHLTTVYLSNTMETGGPPNSFDDNAVHRFVYDVESGLIYTVGDTMLHVLRVNLDPLTLAPVYQVPYPGLKLTDVAVCQEMVIVTYRQTWNVTLGGVLVYQHFDGTMRQLQNVTLRGQPARALVNRGCTVIIVTMENEPYLQRGQPVDPLGEIALLRFPRGLENPPSVIVLNFTQFDNRFNELSAKGVRWPYRRTGFSRNLEPENAVLSDDEVTVYVSLQENNAVAVVDLWHNSITALYGLGFKSWSTSRLDPSDRDGGIHIEPWPLYGMYMPGGMALASWEGRNYLLTANEGGLTDYDVIPGFVEQRRGREFNDSQLSLNVSSELRQALRNDTKLGRLMLSTVDGVDSNGRHHSFYTFGGRSFSIWSLPNMELVYDSGSILEDMLAQVRPDLFNAGMTNASHKVSQDFDSCSADTGPDTESIAVGKLEDRLLIFVGNECPGTIAVFSLSDVTQPRFETYYTQGIPKISGSSWQQMYQDQQLHAIDPESIRFYNSEESPTGFPILMVSGSVSGTLSVLRVEVTNGVTRFLPNGELVLFVMLVVAFWKMLDS